MEGIWLLFLVPIWFVILNLNVRRNKKNENFDEWFKSLDNKNNFEDLKYKEELEIQKLNKQKLENEIYLSKLNNYLDTFDENVEKDSLEVDLFDKEEEIKYWNMFQEECKNIEESSGIDGRWSQEKWYNYYVKLKQKEIYNNITDDELKMKLAFEKFGQGNQIDFGKKIGRSNDRYDYFMYLKCGLNYKAKYITQEELMKILKENKYGYSKHLIF